MKKLIIFFLMFFFLKNFTIGQTCLLTLKIIPFSGGQKGYFIKLQDIYFNLYTQKLININEKIELGDTLDFCKIKLRKNELKKINRLLSKIENNIKEENQICIDGYFFYLDYDNKKITINSCDVNNYDNLIKLIRFILKKTNINL